jgi:serine protease Do
MVKIKPIGIMLLVILAIASTGTLTVIPQSFAVNEGYSPALIAELGEASTVLIYSRIDATVKVFIWNDNWQPTTDYILVPITVGALGSGFFVSSDGYIVTAGHVLFSFTHTDITQDLYTKYALINGAFSVLVSALEQKLGRQLTSTELANLESYIRTYGELQDSIRQVYAVLGEVKTTLTDVKAKGWVARVVSVSPYIERDLALLKVEGLTNTPILKVGDSDRVMTGDSIDMFGFPAVVTFHVDLGPETRLAPSMTNGIISQKVFTNTQTPSFQTTAAITHGMSGGPALNAKGEVIGICSRGSVTEAGQEVAGFDFLIQSNVMKSLLTESNVANTQGPVDAAFLQGLNYYYGRHFSAAKKEFETAAGLFAYHWRAQALILECNAAIARGEDVPLGSNIETWMPIVIGLGAAAIVSVVAIALARRRKIPAAPPA